MRKAADIAAAAGIAGVLVPLAGVGITPIWRFPGTNVSARILDGYVVAHHDALQMTMLCYAVGIILWLVFGVATAVHLHATLPRSTHTTALTLCLAAGTTGFVTLLLAGFATFDVLVYRAPHLQDPRLLYDMTFGLLAMSGLPTAVALSAYAVLVYRGHTLPRWTASLAAITALAHLALLASFIVPDGFASLEGQIITAAPALLWAWIISTGFALRRHG